MTVLQYYVYSTVYYYCYTTSSGSGQLVLSLVVCFIPPSCMSETVQYRYTTHCNDYFTHTWSVLVPVMCHSQYYPYLLLSYVCIQYTFCSSYYCYLAPVQTLHVSYATFCLLLLSVYALYAYLLFSTMTYMSVDDSVSFSGLFVTFQSLSLLGKTLVMSISA